MKFDHFSVTLLILRPDAPQLDEKAATALQDAHMAHIADLHEAGHLLASGPLLGDPNEKFRGLSILSVQPERARALKEQDPAVRAGRFSIKVLGWQVPAGAMAFSAPRFPRSIAEAMGAEEQIVGSAARAMSSSTSEMSTPPDRPTSRAVRPGAGSAKNGR